MTINHLNFHAQSKFNCNEKQGEDEVYQADVYEWTESMKLANDRQTAVSEDFRLQTAAVMFTEQTQTRSVESSCRVAPAKKTRL